MSDIAELERRIVAALDRIGAGLDGLAVAAAVPDAAPATPPPDTTELDRLREELEAERAANGQLNERVRAIRERQETTVAGLERKLDRLTRQLDVQGLELQRMKKTNIGLRESLRQLREAQEAGVAEPHLINKSMLAELEALRAARMSEMAEMEEILSELAPLIGEEHNA